MTERRDEDRPTIDDARQASGESHRRAEDDWRASQERVKRTLTLAEKLKRLREENGFGRLFDDAFGGGSA